MKKYIPDNCVDLVFCDLPFGMTKCHWDKIIPFPPLWEQWERICKKNSVIVLKGQQPFTTDIINSNRKMFKYDLVWDKKRPTGHLNAKRQPLRQHETLLIFYKNQPIYNPQMHKNRLKRDFRGKVSSTKTSENYGKQYQYVSEVSADSLSYPRSIIEQTAVIGNSKAKRKHPTQTPVPLIEWVIKTYTNEGAVVVDNCVGVWSTPIACANTNRNFVCFEKDFDIFQDGKESYEDHIKLLEHSSIGSIKKKAQKLSFIL